MHERELAMSPSISDFRSRDELIRYFDGYSIERADELAARKSTRPLVKSHMIEVLDGSIERPMGELVSVFSRRGLDLRTLDDDLFVATDRQAGEMGVLERMTPRIVALYSTHESQTLDAWVRRLVARSPELDQVWISPPMFKAFWGFVTRNSKPGRFTQLTFTHDSIFEIDRHEEHRDDAEEGLPSGPPQEFDEITERRAARFRLVDRVETLEEKLESLQRSYSPFKALSQLRFPSPVSRGGHDFYENGKATNRSASFRDHRLHVQYVAKAYESLLRGTEQIVWETSDDHASTGPMGSVVAGSPVCVRFERPLSVSVFERWIESTFSRHNRFRLWGHPIKLGPTKVHVYGMDCHLWQPISMELTSTGCTFMLPRGTCGNVVHRLVTNLQRYIDPGATVHLGSRPYEEVVTTTTGGIVRDE